MTVPADIAGPAASRPEIRSHTGLRGVAALMVVIYHYKDTVSWGAALDRATGVFDAGGIFVDLFFMLSGFIMAAIYGPWFADRIAAGRVVEFLRRRLARLYPLHLATLLAMLVIWMYFGTVWDWGNVLENILMIHAWGMNDVYVLNAPSWSISAEWFLYLIFPLLAWIAGRRGGLVLLGALCLAIYAGLFAAGIGVSFDERLSLLRAVPSFILGMLIFRLPTLPGRAGLPSLLQVASVLIFVTAMHAEWSDIPVLIGFAVLIWATETDDGVVARLMATRGAVWLGLVSYSIYLLHIPVIRYMHLLAGKFAPVLTEPAYETPMVLLCLAVTLLAGHLSYRFFEMPIRRRLQGRRGRAQGAGTTAP